MPFIKKYLKWVAGPLIIGITSFLIINPILKQLSGPDIYNIYVVGDFKNEKSSRDIRDEFIGEPYVMDIDGVKIYKKALNDNGDPADAKRISERLAKKDNTLMIVGHMLSSTTKAALTAYNNCDPQIPVILTTETNPNLIPNNKEIKFKDYVPIYGLSPDDNNQAKIAAGHATRIKEDTNFWVVQDNKNKVYSNYLAVNFIEEVQKRVDKKVMLLTDNNSIPPFGTIKKLKIDCIFFAGTWQNALILINQVNAIYEDEIKKPKIILSDWCVDDKLIDQGKDAVRGVYLTQQMKRKDFEEKGEWGFYGKRAAKIVERILNDARNNIKKGRLKKWLGIHRVEDARKAIKKSMFKMFYKNGTKYREQADFQVWQIKKIQTAEGNVEYKFMDWN